VEPEPQSRAPDLEEPRQEAFEKLREEAFEEPREEAFEEPAEQWRADVPAAAPEPPSDAEIESWLKPRPEFETRPAPEAESAAEPEAALEPEAEPTPGTEGAVFEAREAPIEPVVPESSVGAADDWIVERDPDIDTNSLDVEPLETVETSSDQIREEVTFAETPFDFEPTSAPMELAEPAAEEPVEGAAPEAIPEPPAEAHRGPEPTHTSPPPGVGAFTLGKRDPKDKARRLARVLVSDMIMYNPERHERALANGTLKEDFEDEIRKSWKEYVEQVGEQMARENDYWTEALNDVLAKGQRVF